MEANAVSRKDRCILFYFELKAALGEFLLSVVSLDVCEPIK